MPTRSRKVRVEALSIDDLVGYFRSGEKADNLLRVGIEHEKIGVLKDTLAPIPYEGQRGIGALFKKLEQRGYRPVLAAGSAIAELIDEEAVTLEPGGQLEHSGRPSRSIREVVEDHQRHLEIVKEIGEELGLGFCAVGYRPFGTVDDVPWMPKPRYAVMREYLPRKGKLALHMMLMTATVQASFDYTGEADCAEKATAAASVSPLVSALCANSPIAQGRVNGFQSFRYHVWSQVDPDRCGLPPFFFDGSFSYHRYAEWALDVPMFFLKRGEKYHPVGGMSFRRFLAEGVLGHTATLADWDLHLTTLFPEIRLKKLLEMRGADAVDARTSAAVAALWKGLLYDRASRLEAARLTAGLSFAERVDLAEAVAREGLLARVGNARVKDLAMQLLELTAEGLSRQGASDEQGFLDPLREIAQSGVSSADRAIEMFRRTGGDPRALCDLWAL